MSDRRFWILTRPGRPPLSGHSTIEQMEESLREENLPYVDPQKGYIRVLLMCSVDNHIRFDEWTLKFGL